MYYIIQYSWNGMGMRNKIITPNAKEENEKNVFSFITQKNRWAA